MLETPDGAIFESNAICRYLASKESARSLYPDSVRSPEAKALVDAWVDSSIAVAQFSADLVYPLLGSTPADKQMQGRAQHAFLDYLKALDLHTTSRTFLVGKELTLADVVVAMEFVLTYVAVSLASILLVERHNEQVAWHPLLVYGNMLQASQCTEGFLALQAPLHGLTPPFS